MKEKKQSPVSFTKSEWQGKEVTHRTDRVNIKLNVNPRNPDEKEIREKADAVQKKVKGSAVVRLSLNSGKLILQVPEGTDIIALATELSKEPMVVYAEPDLQIRASVTPNDTRFSEQWALAKINAAGAWDLEEGDGDILIGIIDTGISIQGSALTHPDLNDASRYLLGKDYIAGDAIPEDQFGHGTHVTGTAAAETNNSTGISGMNWASKVYVCKIFDSTGNGSASDFESAVEEIVDFAVAHNQKAVMNLSAHFDVGGATAKDACQYANDHGMILCIAAGNDHGGPVNSPALHSADFAGVIAVGATDSGDGVADFSNVGPEVSVVAPGVGILSTFPTYGVTGDTATNYVSWDGTSMATPHVTGLASLVWSRVGSLTNEQVRDVIMNTAVKLGPGDFDNSWGHGRINAADAVAKAGWDITAVQINLNFIDIPENETQLRAIRLDVKSFHATSFTVTAGPTAPFTMQNGVNSVSLPKTTDYDTPRQALLWVRYTGTVNGDTASGTAQVKCNETGVLYNITITANTIARPSCAMMLVLDKSGSMLWSSGIGTLTREQVLKYSAGIFMSVVREKNGVGIVTFDQVASDLLNPLQGPFGDPNDAFDAPRANTQAALAAYAANPMGATSIGNGIERASNNLAGVTGYDKKAIIVFTDGFENTPKYIADVSSMIGNTVFAVGMGTAQDIQPAALTAICNGHDGAVVLTDQLNNDDVFKLAKYFLQIQAGVNDEQVVKDPSGYVGPDSIVEIPFLLNETDISVDAIVMLPAQGIVDVGLQTPGGEIIAAGNLSSFPTIKLIEAKNVTYFRMTLPVVSAGGAVNAQTGQWKILLKIDKQYYNRYLYSSKTIAPVYNGNASHGVRYTALVHAYSNLRMKCSLAQNSFEPGATLHLRCVLSEYGVALAGSASVVSQVKLPDGSSGNLVLLKTGPGVYEASMAANYIGVYTFTVHADGFTSRNAAFTREQVLTAAIWQGGDQPAPTSSNNPNSNPFHDALCNLLHCLSGSVNGHIKEKWLKEGFSLDALARCFCSKQNTVIK